MAHHLRVGPAVQQVVRRWPAQRQLQLPRPPCARRQRRQGRVPLGGRAWRHPHHHLRRPAGRSAVVRQLAEVARCRQGRPGQHLPADDPRGRRRDAGLRPHRRRPQRGVRRVQRAEPHRPHQRRRGQGAHHRRRRLPARRGVPAEGRRRRGGGRLPHHRARRRGAPRWQRGGDGRRPRPLVPRTDGHRRARVPGRADGQRAAAVPAVHQRHHRQAQGHHAHHRRVSHPGGVHPQVRVRPARRHRRVLVHRRRGLDHRPQLHRLRAVGQRRHPGDVRGGAQLPGQRPLLVDHRALRGHQVLHRPHRHPHVHEVGCAGAGEARPV